MEPHHIPIPYFLGIKMAVNPMIQSVGFSEIQPFRCRTSVKKDTGAIKISLQCNNKQWSKSRIIALTQIFIGFSTFKMREHLIGKDESRQDKRARSTDT